ncbi:hypothetical protein C8N43_3226 [Litoreibacter ponti]|uniref:Uncharacterized protein n=1 Tax=Litoreibacter ponti TaxID=1510457 RepID=A0A2T6BEB9_9RHOB|nr:hypothetical protein [Litoreibacter ponti]PTX54412.1 hypothetical protein C8N43_3226 [Litoreibacter ponti]
MVLFTRLRARLSFPKWHRKPAGRLDHIPRDISDHLARDIGLTAHDLERIRHQTPKRPLL